MKNCEQADTLITLKEYVDVRFREIDRATTLAKEATDHRLDVMNEFRESMRDQTKNYITREEYEAKHQILEGKIENIQKPVWIGIGVVMVLEVLLRFFVK